MREQAAAAQHFVVEMGRQDERPDRGYGARPAGGLRRADQGVRQGAVRLATMAPTDLQDVGEHPRRVAQGVNARSRRVVPGDADLPDDGAAPAGEPDELDVEGEAVDLHVGEQGAREIAAQQLEAALGVADAADGDDPHDDVEQPPHELAIGRLPPGDLRVGEAAAAQHQPGTPPDAAAGAHTPRSASRDRRRRAGLRRHYWRGRRPAGPHPCPDSLQPEPADLAVRRRSRAPELTGSVRAAVVDDQDLRAARQAPGEGEEPIERRTDAAPPRCRRGRRWRAAGPCAGFYGLQHPACRPGARPRRRTAQK